MIPFRTGNLGVERLRAARRGEPLPDPERERIALGAWRALGFDAVEDYVFWELVEPRRGRADWSLHRENAAAARRAGLRYVIYPWAHALPAWFRTSQDFVPSRCLEHGEPGPLPSPFAATTWAALERFLRAVHAGLGDVADGVAGAFPADYGEAGFLSGVAGWLLGEGSHHHTGLWCDEREARRAFAAQARDRHATPGRLGAAWGLPPDEAWEHCPYPGPDATLAHRLDFARCYQGAVTTLTGRMLALLAELFPDRPRELKLGHCSETLELGTDWHALVAVAAETGTVVRFTGSGMGELFTKRLASLCRSYGVPFATEAPREVPERYLVERLFTDVAAGTTSYFEFPEQLQAMGARLDAVRPALGRRPLRPPVALFYPTLDLALQPGQGAPAVVAHCFDAFRRVCDLELLDERQIAAGGLAGLSGLIWLEGGVVPAATLLALQAWIEAGGVLLTGAAEAPRPIDTTGHLSAVAVEGAGASLFAPAGGAPERVRYRLARPLAACELFPGETEARLLLGPGWHGREDGIWAWPQDGVERKGPLSAAAAAEVAARGAGHRSVLCRWSGGRAVANLLRPAPGARAASLVIEAFVPPQAPPGPARVYVDGALLAELSGGGAQRWSVPLGQGGDASTRSDALRVELEAGTHRPGAHGSNGDARELGLLVRRIALVGDESGATARGTNGAAAANGSAGWTAALTELRCDGAAARRVGRGWVLPGDGSPLSALAWLASWLDGAIDGLAPPEVARDPSRRLLVTALEGGRLEHDPESQATRWVT